MTINDLFNQLFGGDFLLCKYNADHGTSVDASVVSGMFEYNHEQWEAQYAKSVISHAETELQPGLSSQKDAIPEDFWPVTCYTMLQEI